MHSLCNRTLMKTTLFTLLALTLTSAASWAQPGPMREHLTPGQQARLKQLRVAFYSEQLALTMGEAQQFWPVVEAHEAAAAAHQTQMRALMEKRPATEAEAETLIGAMAAHRKAEIDLETELLLELLPILGAERAVGFPRLKQEFRRSILEAARKRTGGKPGGLPPRR